MNRLSAAPVLVAATLLLVAAAAGMGWIWLRAGRPDHVDISDVVILLAPLALMLIAALVWGVDDERLAITVWMAFMLGAALPAVHALRVGAASGTLDQWPFALGYGLAYLAAAFLFVVWTASWVSDLAPPADVTAVSPERLRARLLALEQAAPGVQVESGPADDVLRVVHRYRSGRRSSEVRLRIDADSRRLSARSYQGVRGDAPMTPEERQMNMGTRRAGEVHPDAQVVRSADWTVVVPTAERRRMLGLRVVGDGLYLPPEVAARFTDDGGAGAELLPYLLAEVAHQSGWRWSARLLF